MTRLYDHASALWWTVRGLGDPLPADAIDLFNRLLEEARARKGSDSLVHEIPFQGADTGRDELMIWLGQLKVELRISANGWPE